jgi:hypothetical protein
MRPDLYLYEENRARERRTAAIFDLLVGAVSVIGALVYWWAT